MRPILVLLFVACAATAAAQERAAADPFVAVRDADPMELARAVDRHGDDAVLARLDERSPRDVRLAATRAARFMRSPELALERLARLAAGRDPILAPAAARAALFIATELDVDALASREVDPATLTQARALFAALEADETAREDLRAAAAAIVRALGELGVR